MTTENYLIGSLIASYFMMYFLFNQMNKFKKQNEKLRKELEDGNYENDCFIAMKNIELKEMSKWRHEWEMSFLNLKGIINRAEMEGFVINSENKKILAHYCNVYDEPEKYWGEMPEKLTKDTEFYTINLYAPYTVKFTVN
jgi:hypothetical protein